MYTLLLALKLLFATMKMVSLSFYKIVMKYKLYVLLALSLIASFFVPFERVAASEIASCGDNFSNAVQLQEGENTGQTINEGETCYYSVTTNAGHELSVHYKMTGEHFFGSVSLYNSEKNEIVSSTDGEDTLRWLGADSEPTTYYVVVENSYRTDTQLFDISLVDRTDATSGTDAGGDFSRAIDITFGKYTGSLSSFTYGNVGGNDDSDYYKLAVERGDSVELRVTPSGDWEVGCTVYDSNRSELFNEDGLDLEAGQIIQKSFDIQSDGYMYIAVKQPSFGEKWDSIEQYELLITNQNVDEMGGEVVDDDLQGNEDEGVTGAETGTSADANTSTKNLIITLSFIALGILVIVLIVLIIISLGKKNKQKPHKTTSSMNNTADSKNNGQNKVTVTVEEGTDVEIQTAETDTKEEDKPTA